MQRWMQGKMQLAKTHGTAKSGAGRAMGWVGEDRPGRDPQLKDPAPTKARDTEWHGLRLVEVTPVLRKIRGTVIVLKALEDRPVGWCKGRKARRAAQFAK